MRLKIELGLQSRAVPLNYKSLIQGAIYSMLKGNEKTMLVHGRGYRSSDNRLFRLFVFSDIIGDFRLETKTKTMTFSSNGYVELAAYDESIILEIIKHLQRFPALSLGSLTIPIINFEIHDDRCLQTADGITLETISPVTIYKSDGKKTLYYSPDDPEFVALLHDNINRKLESAGYSPQSRRPHIEIISHSPRSGRFRSIFFETYDLRFYIKDVAYEYISMMMNAGVGAKNSMGFGMVRIAP